MTTPDELLALLHRTADAIVDVLASHGDWGPSGVKAGQYASDVAADRVAVDVLRAAGVGVLSEETGRHGGDVAGGGVVVVVDPLDGSTNASRGVPWYATSLCAVDAMGPVAALVVHLVSGSRWEATRGGGARRDGQPIRPCGVTRLGDAMVGLSGYPARHLGWRQYRALGAAALDLCAVADGTLDGYVDCSWNAHGPWDYLGGLLVCEEAGAAVADADGRELVLLGHDDRRTPVAAATPELLEQLVAARASLGHTTGT